MSSLALEYETDGQAGEDSNDRCQYAIEEAFFKGKFAEPFGKAYQCSMYGLSLIQHSNEIAARNNILESSRMQ